MESGEFLDLRRSAERDGWAFTVSRRLCNFTGSLFGGNGLAAAVLAMERTTGRRCAWAAAQFLSYSPEGETIELDVQVDVNGHRLTQAHTVCRAPGHDVLRVSAVLGGRDSPYDAQWAVMPEVPGPEHGEDWVVPIGSGGRMTQEFERRDVTKGLRGAVGAGRAYAWIRHRGGPIVTDAAWLSIVADWALHGVVLAIGHQVLPSSLDNTVRQVQCAATEWLLLDIDAHAVHDGFGHCTTRIFAEDGTLVGLASQTGTMRPMPEGRRLLV